MFHIILWDCAKGEILFMENNQEVIVGQKQIKDVDTNNNKIKRNKGFIIVFILFVIAIGLTIIGVIFQKGINGTYYLINNNSLDKDTWIMIDNNRWKDHQGNFGKIEKWDEDLQLFLGSNICYEGKIEENQLRLKNVLGFYSSYKKENDKDSVRPVFIVLPIVAWSVALVGLFAYLDKRDN